MLFLIFCLACSVFSALQSCRGSSQDGEGRIRPGASAESSRARAALLLRQGDPRGALNLLEPAASDSDPDTSLLLGEAALRCGRYALAGKAFRRVLRARPEDVFATMSLARIAFLEARYADALKQADWVLARSPDRTDARALRTRIRLRLGDLNGAAADARRWADLAPGEAEPLWSLGIVQLRRGDPTGAIEVFRRALARDPAHLPSRLDLARAYAKTGQARLAEEALGEARRLEREQRETARRRADATYHRARALKAVEAGDLREALKDYRDALASDPDNSNLLGEAGGVALKAGDLEEARGYLDRAVERAPSSAPARRLRGEISLARSDPEGALADLQEAVRLDPTDPLGHRALEKAFRALGRPEAEREAALAAELEKKVALPPEQEFSP